MKALSIRQPWAWLIIRPDIIGAESRARAGLSGEIKTIENRCWQTAFRGRVLIHASANCTRREYDDAKDWLLETFGTWFGLPELARLDRGGIIGEVEITDCVSESCNHWFCGPHGFVLANPQPLPFQPCRGMLKFFEPNEKGQI